LTSGRLARVLPAWSLEPVPVHVIYSAQRMLPAGVRTFVDFATAFAKTELDAASLCSRCARPSPAYSHVSRRWRVAKPWCVRETVTAGI